MKALSVLIMMMIATPALAAWSDDKTKTAWELADRANDAREARSNALEEYRRAPSQLKKKAKLAFESADKHYREMRMLADQAALNLVQNQTESQEN